MALSIEHIEREMAGHGITPGQIADFRVYLAALASMRTGELQDILTKKATAWLAIREHKKSDRAADHEWDATASGIREIELRMLLKRIDRLSSALSSKLRVMELEIRNLA